MQHSQRGRTIFAAALIAAALAAVGSLTLAITQPLDGEPTVTPSPRSNSAPVAPAGQLDQPATALVCAAAEDSQPVDCVTGAPLDYRNGGWYR